MTQKKVALLLVEHSDFQEQLRRDAEEAAARARLVLDVYVTGLDFASQLKQISELIHSPNPPSAIVVLPVRDQGLTRSARTAVKAGISWVFLTRTDDDLSEIQPDAAPGTVASLVCPDEVETGRIQGRQYAALLPQGGKVLYVQGSARSLTARSRTDGMQEAIKDTAIDVTPLAAGWSTEEAYKAVYDRLKLLGQIHGRVDLIGCQTDQIAVGALKALDQVAVDLRQPEIADIPVAGCDATAELGQRLVKNGRMVASISLPRVAGPAVEAVARHLSGVAMPPTTFFMGTSYPPIDQLKPVKR
jgi:ABC-type sugar transport system substrate-binding protein